MSSQAREARGDTRGNSGGNTGGDLREAPGLVGAEGVQPRSLVSDQVSGSGGLDPLLVTSGAMAVVFACVAAVLLWRRSLAKRPEAHAMRTLSRSLRLDASERRIIESLASKAGVTPAALLVSPGGLRRIAGEYAGEVGVEAESKLTGLLDRLGG